MPEISKIEAVRIIFKCAKLYNENLSGRNLLFISQSDSKIEYFEAAFLPSNFLHLTGVRTSGKRERFFEAALSERLRPGDIHFDSGGTTELKLSILPQLMSIHTTARMVGDYDNSRPLLIADKFAGTITSAIGFMNVNGIYIPKSALRVDMREITIKATRRRIIAIFAKSRTDELYKQSTYIAKGATLDSNVLAPELRSKIDMQCMAAAASTHPKPLQERLAEAQKKADDHNNSEQVKAPKGKNEPAI